MSGVVVVAGVYEPGSVVTLTQVPDERVLRPEGHPVIAQRVVDDAGNVGFAGLDLGARFFCTGYVAGIYTTLRCRAVDAEAPDSELIQPPIAAVPQKIGTQEDSQPASTAHVPADLAKGVPESAVGAIGIVGVPPEDEPDQPDVESQEVEPSESSGTQTGAGAPSEHEVAGTSRVIDVPPPAAADAAPVTPVP